MVHYINSISGCYFIGVSDDTMNLVMYHIFNYNV